ncbi:MAG: septum site-determining protein MinC [Ostreibacterium sp.]
MNNVLAFKNNVSNLNLLQLHSQQITEIQTALREKIKQAPMMFIGMQVIVDLSEFEKTEQLTLNLSTLRECLLSEGLNLVAIMSNRQSHRKLAVEQGIGAIQVFSSSSRQVKTTQPKTEKVIVSNYQSVEKGARHSTTFGTENAPLQKPVSLHEPHKTIANNTIIPSNQIITHPVRSGQRIYSHGDLTVVGSVSPGAEVIADGNIHIYGALKGRAIAGAQGDLSARIFCQKLEAELVSIAGNYKPNEDIEKTYRQKKVQISLEGEKICFFTL